MSDFKTIETQEQFDEAIKSRLERERKKFEGFTKPEDVQKIQDDHLKEIEALQSQIDSLKGQPETLQKEIDSLKDQNKRYETDSAKTRIAHELGLPYESKKFLVGNDEEEIKASAEELKKILDSNKKTVPLASTTVKQDGDPLDKAYENLLKKVTKEE